MLEFWQVNKLHIQQILSSLFPASRQQAPILYMIGQSSITGIPLFYH
jgi:hypothetical protein